MASNSTCRKTWTGCCPSARRGYAAKAAGGNRWAPYEREMSVSLLRRLDLRSQLVRALERDEIQPWFQPVVDLPTGAVTGFEALARWCRPGRVVLPPGDWIGLAEETGLVVHIDRANERLRVINAGHPAPIVVGPQGAVVLSGVQRPWLGVAGAQLPPTEVAFPDGATLLLYTDGLVEERGEAIDVSIDRLAARVADRVAACADDPTALVEHLLEWRATDRRPTSVDDDIALVAITRR